MADIKTPEERSCNMARIRSKDTKPEIYIRKKLFERGYRYRKNAANVFGHPDIWLSVYNTAVFVHGCYWHRHNGCKYAYVPKSRVDFWMAKFENNVKRDEDVRQKLAISGVRVLIIWECTVKKMMRSETEEQRLLEDVEHFFQSEDEFLEM
ncbi:MAG: DNA mismatch endonuclease Vsr [Lachnospiraceae bacterium]|nr:DNA mismatch endonuclease Vsr [Lachnospiraceae bacterium]